MIKDTIIKFFFLFILSIYNHVYAADIDWSIATTSFPADQGLGDTGHEKTPYGYVDLITGNLVYDVPEVGLKGDRGLDFTLSRSYGKVNNGFRSMGNWELESPRLVMMTGPSTKLKGDESGGICISNGDTSNGTASSGRPYYSTGLLNTPYADKIRKSYTDQVAIATAKQVLNSIVSLVTTFGSTTGDNNSAVNKSYASQAITNLNNLLNNNAPEIYGAFLNNVNLITISEAEAITEKNKYGSTILNLVRGYEQKGTQYPEQKINFFVNGRLINQYNILSELDKYDLDQQLVVAAKYVDPSRQGGLWDTLAAEVALTIKQPGIGYAYYSILERVKKADFSNNVYTSKSLQLSTTIDTRSRPISLYLPAQKNRTFYPVNGSATAKGYPANAKYISQDNWYITCENSGKDFKVRAANGITYYFPSENRENQTGYPSIFGQQFIPGRVSVYASKVENQFGESYLLNYLNKSNSALVYAGYNLTNKLFLTTVVHQLDGVRTSDKNDLELVYVKNNVQTDGSITEIGEANFDTNAGDISLKSIKRLVRGDLLTWASYVYQGKQTVSGSYKSSDSMATGGTVGEFQDAQAASLYLSAAGYISGDAISYVYGGPYRLVGNVMPQTNGITKQDFIWFYSDLSKILYFKKQGASGQLEASATVFDYEATDIGRPGFNEAKSYRIKSSTRTGASTSPYKVSYAYEARNTDNEQVTTVTVEDASRALSRSYSYKYYSFAKGSADSFLHGLLKNLTQADRSETYTWTQISSFGLSPKTANNNYTDYDSVDYVRLSKKAVSHFGSYTTEQSNFDIYANAQTIIHRGLKGTTAVSRTTALDFFNASPANSEVEDGSLPWLIGLPKSSYNGSYFSFVTVYDELGAITSDTRKGALTRFKYETVQFSSCLGILASFEWQGFINCIGNYIAGNKHNGLPFEKDVGNGELVTYYADYKKGIPANIRNPNGSIESSEVDDFGNITKHTDADGIVGIKVYDDAGRIKEDRPVDGLAYTKTVYDGLKVTTTTYNGGAMVSTQNYDGDGNLISIQQKLGNRSIYTARSYDAFGNLRFDSYPSPATNPALGIKYDYDDFNRVKQVDNNGAKQDYCYQSCGGVTGAIATISDSAGTSTQQYYAVGDFDTSLVTVSERKGTDNSVFTSSVEYDTRTLLPLSSTQGNSSQTYRYYLNGLLKTVYDANTADAAKLSTYTYDDAGRVKSIKHPDSTLETFTFNTKIGDLADSRNWNNETINYDYSLAGRLKSTSSPGTSLTFGLDAYGRTRTLTQLVNTDGLSKTYRVIYGYNKLSQITSITYPNNKVADLSNQDQFGEISTIPDVIQSITYNELHQPKVVTANSDLSWSYDYDIDGKIKSLTHTAIDSCQLSLGYGYDNLRRLKTITDGCGNNYRATLERFGTGQLKKATLSQGTYEYTYTGDDIATVKITGKQTGVNHRDYTYNYVTDTSRVDSIGGSEYTAFSYDLFNRVKHDGVRGFNYDAFGRVKLAGTDKFYYTPDNLRVRAVRGTDTTDYLYGIDGELLYEVDLSSGLAKSHVYAGGLLVASLESFPNTDSDGDGLTDVEEQEFGLNPDVSDASRDTDDDGLPDYLERYLGLNPNNDDTDGDGFSDGYEYNTLGLLAALKADIFPSEPEPPRDNSGVMVPIIDLLLSDDEI